MSTVQWSSSVRFLTLALVFGCGWMAGSSRLQADDREPTPTRDFAIRVDRAYLGGQSVRLWGLRSEPGGRGYKRCRQGADQRALAGQPRRPVP